MKKIILFLSIICLICGLTSCNQPDNSDMIPSEPVVYENAVDIVLSDIGITVAGEAISTDSNNEVYSANDIVYYESGKDFTYGEGSESDSHTAEVAAEHTVLHITKAGVYKIQGKLSKGQIAIDLGTDAKEDPTAVVTLVLNGVDITCQVAPAIIFYRVYECGNTDTETATKDVDTSAAGANVIIADGTENTVNGSYVARIYKPGTVVLNEAGTEVEDAKKLHKYDGALYSKMSMNVCGEPNGSGKLTIYAENEGLDTELHLTINGGIIDIFSGNDGINTNEDGVSVTTINGGDLTLTVTGETGEGDGIDSNGWLVINGGTVKAYACAMSGDAGIDSDMGIYINGGTVLATGNMLDRIAGAQQNCAIFNFIKSQVAGSKIVFKSSAKTMLETELKNNCSILIYSNPELNTGKYTLYVNDVQYGTSVGGEMGNSNGMMPGGEMPEGQQPPDMQGGQPSEMPNGQQPQMPNDQPPEMPDGQRPQMPNGQQPSEIPQGGMAPENGGMGQGGRPNDQGNSIAELSNKFEIADGINTFYSVGEYTGGNNNLVWIIVISVVIAGLVAYGIIVTVKLYDKKKQA